MFHYSEEDKNLIGFVSLTDHANSRTVCSNAVILLPGLMSGFMCTKYTEYLSKELIATKYSLVQVQRRIQGGAWGAWGAQAPPPFSQDSIQVSMDIWLNNQL